MTTPASYKTRTVAIRFPEGVIERVTEHAKRLQMRYTVLIQNTVVAELERLDDKVRQAEMIKNLSKAEKRRKAHPFGPVAPTPHAEEEVVESRTQKQVQAIYDEQAKRICKVLDKPYEKRILVIETVNKILKTAPLSHPTERVIIATLEELVASMIAQEEAEKPPKVEMVIDPTAVESAGGAEAWRSPSSDG